MDLWAAQVGCLIVGAVFGWKRKINTELTNNAMEVANHEVTALME